MVTFYMNSRPIDLHTHTHCSDGVLSPADVVRKAAECGLAAVAITDHDTTAGISEALIAGQRYGIEVIAGVEISARHPSGALHLLGYFIDIDNTNLQNHLQGYLDARNRRNPLILDRLEKLGCPLDMDEITALAEGKVINRPHIAQALLNRGYVQSRQEAFDRFLANDGLAYVAKEVFDIEEVIDFLHGAGGLAVLAHPNQLNSGHIKSIEQEIRKYAGLGIDGVEAYHVTCARNRAEHYAELANELGLIVTGGSDFHGDSGHYGMDESPFLSQVTYRLLETMKKTLVHKSSTSVDA